MSDGRKIRSRKGLGLLGEVVTGDSAVAVYWDPVELYYGEQTYFATYYGLAGEGGGDTWLDAPGEISCEEREFEVVLWVVNNTVFALTGGQSTLTLPSGLDLVSGEATTKAWSDIPPGEAASVSWLVAASGAADATVTVQASTSFAGGANYTPDPFDITVPLCEAGPLQAPTGLTADPGRQSIELSWEPSPSLGVEGYNVYRSESSGGPFAQVNAALANTAFYQDADPALITGTTYYYGVTSVAGADESQRSETANATFGTLELLIPDSHGPRDATVVLPINIANASGLEMDSMDVRLTYPTETLRLVPGGVQRTPLSENFVFGVNETQSGTVQILLAADVETLWGEGTLFQLLFEVVGPEGTEGPLEFDDAGTEIWSVDDDVSPVPLTLRDGTFQVQRNFGLGDLNGDGKVSSKDVTLAMRIAVGKSTPDAEQQAAGDVNGDGRVNSADTALIIRIALGMDTVPTRRNRIATRARVGSELTVSLGSLDGSPGSTVRVPIDVSDAAQIAGADLTVNYDANVVEVVGVELDSWVQGNSFRLETNINDNTDEVSTPGQLRISLAQLQDSTHQGLPGGAGERTLLEVEFAIKRSAQDGDTPLTLSNVRLNDPYGRDFVSSALQNTVSAGSGQITIGERQIYLPLVLRNG